MHRVPLSYLVGMSSTMTPPLLRRGITTGPGSVVSSEEIGHVSPACLYVLKRDDTHGTSYEVGVYDTMQEAQSKLDALYFNEHHQHYYISKLPDEPKK